MRFPRLRATLQRLALASLASAPLAAAGCACPPDQVESRVVRIDPTTTQFSQLVQECRPYSNQLNAPQCRPLCDKVMSELGIVPYDSAVTECFLEDVSSTEADLHMAWLAYRCEGAGRRPAGLSSTGRVGTASPVGAWLATMAHLEAAAVYAFADLAAELATLDAPADLVHRALRAADDEVRHTQMMAALARAHGVIPAAPVVAPPRHRTLEELAADNAVEGCTREAFGAVVAARQARTATDPTVAAALAVIADEEMGHAELSWAIHDWALAKLDDTAVDEIEKLRRAAAAELAAADYGTEPVAVRAALGLPDAASGRALATSFAAAIG
jgi:hypothetical protein